MSKKITEAQLRERLHLLWMAGDAGIMSNYRDAPISELWDEYGWVADQSADLFDFLRGGTAERKEA